MQIWPCHYYPAFFAEVYPMQVCSLHSCQLHSRWVCFLATSDKFPLWKNVTGHLTSENVKYVENHLSPDSIPEVCSIEKFWSYLKPQVHYRGWKAKIFSKYIIRIKFCMQKANTNVVQWLSLGTMRQINSVQCRSVDESNYSFGFFLLFFTFRLVYHLCVSVEPVKNKLHFKKFRIFRGHPL